MNETIIVESIIAKLGSKDNVATITNCMTRLRVVVKDESMVDEKALSEIETVLGIIHDRDFSYEIVVGPGRSRKYADICKDLLGASISEKVQDMGWKANKEEIKNRHKQNIIRDGLKIIGDIFVPLIPGIITAGLCSGFASLLAQLVPDLADHKILNVLYLFLVMINQSFMTYITAWAGYRAAERFGATPILGGMLGMITSLDGINSISGVFGLFNDSEPLRSILRVGKGGILSVICGVLILSFVEKKVRKHVPANLDIIFIPLITLFVCVLPYVLIIMPVFGYLSDAIVWVFSKACMSESVLIRLVTGYVASTLFLPLVAAGMHHGLVALYAVQLQEIGYVTLYPALAMAGAGQVGAAIAVYQIAKKVKHKKLCSVIAGALPAGFLGVGEPLIYGVTLPMGRPFITAGLGAGFGGALVMFFQVASTTWGPSGIIGAFVMTAGPYGAIVSVLVYLLGLIISYIMSYIITKLVIKENDVINALGGI